MGKGTAGKGRGKNVWTCAKPLPSVWVTGYLHSSSTGRVSKSIHEYTKLTNSTIVFLLNHHHPRQPLTSTPSPPPTITSHNHCSTTPMTTVHTNNNDSMATLHHQTDERQWGMAMTWHINGCATSSRWWPMLLSPASLFQVSSVSPQPLSFFHTRSRGCHRQCGNQRWTSDNLARLLTCHIIQAATHVIIAVLIITGEQPPFLFSCQMQGATSCRQCGNHTTWDKWRVMTTAQWW